MSRNHLAELGDHLTTPGKRRWRLRWRHAGTIAGVLAVLGLALLVRYFWGNNPASAQTPPGPQRLQPPAPQAPAMPRPQTAPAQAPAATAGRSQAGQPGSAANGPAGAQPAKPQVVAVVNGEPISRTELGREAMQQYGEQILEGMVNKRLIAEECQRRGITVTRAEVEAEIGRLAQHFKLPVDQWLKLLQDERGITPEEYAEDIIWTTLALRKLAGTRLTVSQTELVEEFERCYGPAVEARLIACGTLEKAREVHARAKANPELFGRLAKEYSEDASASLEGRIQPIRKHCGYAEIEQAAFSLEPGEVSEVIAVGGQYLILQCERKLPGSQLVRFQEVAPRLEEVVRERKLREAAGEIFQALQRGAQVVNVLNDPLRRQSMPGVAATINGQPISIAEVAEKCIERHGKEVLEGMIDRRLIAQALKQKNQAVSAEEVEAEVAYMAGVMVPPKPDGAADVEGWLKAVAERTGMSPELYRAQVAWPAAALKKLIAGQVVVTDDDLRKGYEANYGPRVRCRAIVLGDFRRAQEVWEKARQNPTAEHFGDLAAQYSIEAGSQALRGEVPPIRKHGGQPLLEKEAFALKPGELSGIIQVGDKYVILLCEGFTEPTKVAFEEVRGLLYEDLFEKKQQLAMMEYFEQLKESATIDNFLAGESRAPARASSAAGPPPRIPTLRQVPAG